MLLPEALQDWLPEGHLAYFISDTVDGLDLQAFHARYASGARKNNLGQTPEQALADTRYRSEAVFEQLADSGTDLVVALGREGKQQLGFDPARSPRLAQMAAKLQSAEGKAAYRRRKWIAEPPNGRVKNVLGFRQFSLRGLHRVQAEWKLVCLALNLSRMCVMKAA